MFREITLELRKWHEEGMKSPLLVTGIKGIGKTYTVLDFVTQEFQQYAYINLENDGLATSFFNSCSSKMNFEELIGEYLRTVNAVPGQILILDEISFCPCLVSMVNQYLLSGAAFPIVLISSYVYISGKSIIELLTGETASDRIMHLKMFPLSFGEYLTARNKEWYGEVIRGHFEKRKPVPAMIHEEMLDLFDEYLQLGGMPDVVNEFLRTGSFNNVTERQLSLYSVFLNSLESRKEKDILEVIPSEAATDANHFVFTLIRRGVTLSMYSEAIEELSRNGMVLKCLSIDSEQNVVEDRFRLFYPDFGILRAKLKRAGVNDEKTIRKSVLRNYVMQELIRKHGNSFYWQSEQTAAVDFCFYNRENDLCPVQPDYFERTRNRSIKLFEQIFEPGQIFRVGEENFNVKDHVYELPLYAVYML